MNYNKPTVKLKTMQFTIDNMHNKMLDDMTTISKNILNCCIYANNFFSLYKNKIYKEIYEFFININNSELSIENKKKLINSIHAILYVAILSYYLLELVKNKKNIDLIFIDGWHTFDYTLMDLFYSYLLVKLHGYIIIDDALHPGVSKVIRYINTNYKSFL